MDVFLFESEQNKTSAEEQLVLFYFMLADLGFPAEFSPAVDLSTRRRLFSHEWTR